MVFIVSPSSGSYQTDLNQTEVTVPMAAASSASLTCEDQLVKRVADLLEPLTEKVCELFTLISKLTTTITASLPTAQATSLALAISKREIVEAATEIADCQKRSHNIVIRGRFKGQNDPTSFAREILRKVVRDDLLDKLQYAQWLRKNVGRARQTIFSGIIVTFSSTLAANEVLSLWIDPTNLPNVRSITKDYSPEECKAHRASKNKNKKNCPLLKSLRVVLTPLPADKMAFPIRKHLSLPDLRTPEASTLEGTTKMKLVSELTSSCESLATVINCPAIPRNPICSERSTKRKFTTSTPTRPKKGNPLTKRNRTPQFTPIWSTPVDVTPQKNTGKCVSKPSQTHFRLRVGNRVRPKGQLNPLRRPYVTNISFPARNPQKPKHQRINPLFPAWINAPTPYHCLPMPAKSYPPSWNFLQSPPPRMSLWTHQRGPRPMELLPIGQTYPHQLNGPYPQYIRTV